MAFGVLFSLCLFCGSGALAMLLAPDARWVRDHEWALQVFTWGFIIFGVLAVLSTKWVRKLLIRVLSVEQVEQKTIQAEISGDRNRLAQVGSMENVSGSNINLGGIQNVHNPARILTDPIVHLEPELGQVKASGQRVEFILVLVNTGLEDINLIDVFVTWFVALKSLDGNITLKSVGPILTVPNHRIAELDKNSQIGFEVLLPMPLQVLNEVAAANKSSRYLFGVRVIISFRRTADGKSYELVRGYGMDLNGTILYVPSPNLSPLFDLSEVIPYLKDPSHWSHVARIISSQSSGYK